jgi:CBS domain
MEAPVLFIGPDLTAEEFMAVKTDKRVRYLPVIDEGKLMGIISIGDLVKNIISNHQFTIDSCLIICTARGVKIPKYARGSWHRHFAVRRLELDNKTIGIETG